jgi:hypothetical protein
MQKFAAKVSIVFWKIHSRDIFTTKEFSETGHNRTQSLVICAAIFSWEQGDQM